MKKISLYLLLATSLFSGLAVTLRPAEANALSGSQFTAGNIADDSVFFNSGTMSANDIQAFLNAKVPSCDTNGNKSYSGSQTRAQYGAANGNPAPYTCLRDYVIDTPSRAAESGLCNSYNGGTKSAAQIIYDVSVSCGINPQVLLILLQKEQSLVTDDWPWARQYRSATGYGCPDTAACDAAYYGLFNQVYSAARGYKKYARDAGNYNYRAGRNNNIQYNPNAGCGASSVYIQNQATAGLYIYTPYQPNQAALNNLYGSGDGCSAYGNRNFWRMFNDWFGPSVGPLVRTQSSGDLYYSDGATKYRVTSMDMAAEYGLGLSSVRIIPQQTMDALATSTSTPYLTYLVKSTSDSDEDGGNIYLVTGGKRYVIPSMSLLADYGFSTSQIGYLEYSQLFRLPNGGNLTNFVKSSYGGYVFKVTGGSKRAIVDYNTLVQQNPSGSVQDVSAYVLGSIPTGNALINGNIVMRDPGGGIWLVMDSTWHYVPSMTAFNCLGLNSLATINYSTYQTDVGPQGPDASCAVQSTSGSKYILDNYRRIPIDSSWGMTDLFSVSDSFANRLGTYNPTAKPVFRSAANAPLYILNGGKKRQIYSMSSFAQRGYVMNDLFTTSSDFLATIPTGSLALANGSVIQDSSNGRIYIMDNDQKYYVPSMGLFNAYGLETAPIVSLDSTAVASYTTGGTLNGQLVNAGGSIVFDSGIALQIPNGLESAFGFSGSTPTYPAGIAANGALRTGTRYLKFGNSGQLYYMENGTKRPVYSWDRWVELGGSNSNITGLSASAANLWPTGSPM